MRNCTTASYKGIRVTLRTYLALFGPKKKEKILPFSTTYIYNRLPFTRRDFSYIMFPIPHKIPVANFGVTRDPPAALLSSFYGF